MGEEFHNLKIVLILTFGFGFASILGYLTNRLKLSPILGYMIAGYLIGPFSPGFVADLAISEQLAEIGVILMMFGVGLHFKWTDLMKVKNVAIPGAIIQTLVTTVVGAFVLHWFNWTLNASIIYGLALAIASTIVLVRVLTDNNLLNTLQGHLTVGWLVVEDILTIFALVLLPILAFTTTEFSFQALSISIVSVIVKFGILIILLFTLGRKFVKFVFEHVARTRSHELFTLTVLALTFVIAVGSTVIFGTSIALGAFLVGMIIGQTNVNHQVTAFSNPIKDIFSVIFFLAVGMLFNPAMIVTYPLIFILTLIIILVIKPLVAFAFVVYSKYPIKTALTVAIALAQIGEFSFILAEEASRYNILPDEGYDIIVACAIISIALNPLYFKCIGFLDKFISSKYNIFPKNEEIKESNIVTQKALIIGFGPIGQAVSKSLISMGITPIVIDRNIDAINLLKKENKEGVYGDATQTEILQSAQIKKAKLLVITVPELSVAIHIIKTARSLNPKIQIITRTQYLTDEEKLTDFRVKTICVEKEESKAFVRALFETH